jgi:mycothiol synthase
MEHSLRAPLGYVIRSATRADLDGIRDLLRAFDVADFGREDMHAQHVGEDWKAPRFDPARHALVGVAPDDSLAGYGQVFDEESVDRLDAYARVHPEHRARGLGVALLEATEIRAVAHAQAVLGGGPVRLQHVVTSSDLPAHDLLGRRGFVHVRTSWHMEARLDAPIDVGPAPEGIRVVGADPASGPQIIYELFEVAFRDHWDFVPVPFEVWNSWNGPDPDIGLWLIAMSGDRAIGAITPRAFGDRGWVSEVGVLPEWRARGVASHLLRVAFAELRRRGFGTVTLNVDAENTTGATRIYERAGMTIRRQWLIFEKRIDARMG